MRYLELLAPARNKEIGIAAIDCGADAVYIGGPDFGARKAAGNSIDDIAGLCEYAHRYGARVFVTANTLLREDEFQAAREQMILAQEAGTDAFIVRDPAIFGWEEIRLPLHASTQCAIRTVERARMYEALGCSRLVLERELPLRTVREIASAVNCEIEFFVHGALCVCYSGECTMSEHIDGRSADRGECIQACRSLYDLTDSDGRVLMKNKAVLSLKDYNLKNRLAELAAGGVCSFKIEGRLKNISYVRNVVREYDLALNELVEARPELYARASFGRVSGGFSPDSGKTFNRGYTELFIDGRRNSLWSSMDAPKSMGEKIGSVARIRRPDPHTMRIDIKPLNRNTVLHNGDGFAFINGTDITGFRGDICEGMSISCRNISSLKEGTVLYRNIDSAFEKLIESNPCRREIRASLSLRIHGKYVLELTAKSEDGRSITSIFNADVETASNTERAMAMLCGQFSKRAGIYSFTLDSIKTDTPGGRLPLLSASTINGMRRMLAEDLDSLPCRTIALARGGEKKQLPDRRILEAERPEDLLMRSKYCVRHELGMCPKSRPVRRAKDTEQSGRDRGLSDKVKEWPGKNADRLYIINNGRRFALDFDCRNCEMTVTQVQK